MKLHIHAPMCAAVLSLLAAGCNPVEGPALDEELAEAQPAQVDPDIGKDYKNYHFDIGNNPLLDLLVMSDETIEGFAADTEYWYVDSSALAALGEEDIEVSSTSGDGMPPSLSGDQEFTQPVFPTWQPFSTDPVSVGELYSNAAGDIHIRIKVESGEITRIVWYQTISSQSPTNVRPDGAFTPVGGSVTVPSGEYGYYIDATIE